MFCDWEYKTEKDEDNRIHIMNSFVTECGHTTTWANGVGKDTERGPKKGFICKYCGRLIHLVVRDKKGAKK